MIGASWTELRRSGALPGLAMLVAVVALNAWLQPHFFGRPSLESNIATFAPTILVCVGQALVVLNRQLDLSLGAGVSLLNCALAAVPADIPGDAWTAAGIALLLALGLGAVNGAWSPFWSCPR
jgi:ribose transport system permease protein